MNILEYTTDVPENLKDGISESDFNEATESFLSKNLELENGEIIKITKEDLKKVLIARSKRKKLEELILTRDPYTDSLPYNQGA